MAKTIKPGMDGKMMKQIARKSWTQKQDDADDAKRGIKPGSKQDLALDRSRGLKGKKKKSLSTAPAKARYDKEDKDLNVKTKKKESASPLIKPSHRGLLHRELGVKQGSKIPSGKMDQALNSQDPKIRKQANFARNFSK